ncbi:type II secretion system F family protein [Angustibacter speluncae]
MTPVLTGALIGLLGGLGAWLVLVRLPAMRRPTLDDRLAPYVRDVAAPSTLLRQAPARTPFGVLERLLRPVMGDAVRWVERLSGGPGTVRRRLDQLGGTTTVEQFRAQQVVGGALGLAAGLGGAALVGARQGLNPLPMLAMVVIGLLVGVFGRDQLLSRAVRRREERILTEFPTVAELLALSVGAGEGPVGALERVARTTSGELAVELRRTLADARAGATLVEALEGLAARTSLPILVRFVDGVAVAVERGTPLADVLRAQAQDVREAGRRELMETGGKKEIAMMVPVVFLVLPVTVVFAVYPGLAVLSLDLG